MAHTSPTSLYVSSNGKGGFTVELDGIVGNLSDHDQSTIANASIDVQPVHPVNVTQGCANATYIDPVSGVLHNCAHICPPLANTLQRCKQLCPEHYTCLNNTRFIHSTESLSKTTVTSASTVSRSFYPDTVAYDIPTWSILVGITALCICLIVLVFCCCLFLKCKKIHFYWDKLVRLCFGKSHQDSPSQKVLLKMKRSRASTGEQEDELGSPCSQGKDNRGLLEQVSLLQANLPSTSIDAENVITGLEPRTSLRDKVPKGPVRVVSNAISMDIETGGSGLQCSCDGYPIVNSILTNSSTFFSPMEHSGTKGVADINPFSDGHENHVEVDSAAVERNSVPDCMAKQISSACGVNNRKKYVVNEISCQTAQPDSSDQKNLLSQAINELPDAGDRAIAKESITYPSDAMSCADSWKGSVERELHTCQHQAGTPLQSELLDDSLKQSASPDIGYTNHVSLPLRVSTKSPPLDTRGVSRDFEFCSFEAPSVTGCLDSSNSSLESYLGSLMPEEGMEALSGNASAVVDEQTIPKQIIRDGPSSSDPEEGDLSLEDDTERRYYLPQSTTRRQPLAGIEDESEGPHTRILGPADVETTFEGVPRSTIRQTLNQISWVQTKNFCNKILEITVDHVAETEDKEKVKVSLAGKLGIPVESIRLMRLMKGMKPVLRLTPAPGQTGVWLDGSYHGLSDAGSALSPEDTEFTIGAEVKISGMTDQMALTVSHAFDLGTHPRCYYKALPEVDPVRPSVLPPVLSPVLLGTTYVTLDQNLVADAALIRIDPHTKLDSFVCSTDGSLKVTPKLLESLDGLEGEEVTTLSPAGLACLTGEHNDNCCCGRVYCADYHHQDFAFPTVAVTSVQGDDQPFHGEGDSGTILIKRQLHDGNVVEAIGILFATFNNPCEEGTRILSLSCPLKDVFPKFESQGLGHVTFPTALVATDVPHAQHSPDSGISTLNGSYPTMTTPDDMPRRTVYFPTLESDKCELNLNVQPSGLNTSAGVSSYQATSEPSLRSPDRQELTVPQGHNTRLTSSDQGVYDDVDSGLDSSSLMQGTSTPGRHRHHTYDCSRPRTVDFNE